MLRCVVRGLCRQSCATVLSPAVRVGPIRQQQQRSIQASSSISMRKKMGPMSYFLLIIPGAAFCLGCWQVQRRQWKLGLIAHLKEKIALDPLPLPLESAELPELEYRRVLVSGRFDHSRELLLGPRPALHGGRYNEQGSMLSSGATGFLVVTPFTLSDSGQSILVNRGWVSKRCRNPNTRIAGQVTGEQTLTGVVRLQETRGPFMPKNMDSSKFFIYRDIETMSALTGSSPVFVDACEGVVGGPLAGQTRVTLRNEHLSYLLTWYSLSFITGFMWYRRYINPRAFI